MNLNPQTVLFCACMLSIFGMMACSKHHNNSQNDELETVKSNLADKTWHICCDQRADNSLDYEWPNYHCYFQFYGTDSVRYYQYDNVNNNLDFNLIYQCSVEIYQGKICLILFGDYAHKYEILESTPTHFSHNTVYDDEWHYYTDYETSKYANPF